MVYKFFDKKFSDSGIKNESMSDQKLSEVLHKPILENLIKEKYIHLFGNIWDADLADMQLISKFNKVFRLLLYVIDIYSKYAWVITLKDKKVIAITNPFQKI